MPPWTDTAVGYVQLAVNLGALVGGAAVWKLYFDALKASLGSKDAEISNVESSREYWKEKAGELEKRSPEFMEKMLEDRIKTRESELARLKGDQEAHEESLRLLREEKARLEDTLQKTKAFQSVLALEAKEGLTDLDDPTVSEDFEVVRLGEVGVDSGQLLITDPCYVDSEWTHEPFRDLPVYYEDKVTGLQLREGTDFARPDELIPALGGTVKDLVTAGRLVMKDERPESFAFSYQGACDATGSTGYGELVFSKGHPGAGVAFTTGFGDGIYPIYGELRGGRMVRVYVNVS